MAYDKNKMQDIKFSEKELWQEYLSLWNNQDVSGIANFLNNNPQMKYKVFNAYNWNRLIDSVNDATFEDEATEDSLVGTWNLDYAQLINASNNFKYVGDWNSGISYKINNLVKFDDYHSYFCIQNHTASNTSAPPNAAYWLPADAILGVVGIPIAETEPLGMIEGDIYLEIQS